MIESNDNPHQPTDGNRAPSDERSADPGANSTTDAGTASLLRYAVLPDVSGEQDADPHRPVAPPDPCTREEWDAYIDSFDARNPDGSVINAPQLCSEAASPTSEVAQTEA